MNTLMPRTLTLLSFIIPSLSIIIFFSLSGQEEEEEERN